MAGNIVAISGKGGPPIIEIIIGQAQWGSYKIYLWDPPGHNYTLIGSGLSDDNVEDRITLNQPVNTLDSFSLTWEVNIQSSDGGAGELYSVVVRVLQDGNLAGEVVNEGPLDKAQFVFNKLRFQVQ